MRSLIKTTLMALPAFVKVALIGLYETFFRMLCLFREKKEYALEKKKNVHTGKKRLLFYHITGMNYGGTEKALQILANSLVEDFDVFFLYSAKNNTAPRKIYMNERITCIEFDYTEKEPSFPFFIHGMKPHIKNVIEEHSIDVLITADSGQAQYPFNTITNIPIILINIFGSPAVQKNIIKKVHISKAIQTYSERLTGPLLTNTWAHLPIMLPPSGAPESGKALRNKLGFTEDSFVFGRIGRGSDSIFDPIGINAFEKIVAKNPNAYYLIMSPPPILEKIVAERKIPHVFFLPASGDEKDVWAFYYAIDTLAHFRHDGESFGLNIAEAMYAGKPIISHRSHIWNAHLEYLKEDFSRVSEKDDVAAYADFMQEYITLHKQNAQEWSMMGRRAHEYAQKYFSIAHYSQIYKDILASLFTS